MTYQTYANHYIRPRTEPACCPSCDDGEGLCVFPYHGMAPHEYVKMPGTTIRQRVELPQSEWPANFLPDGECDLAKKGPVTGVYTHCLDCRRPSRYAAELIESDGGEHD